LNKKNITKSDLKLSYYAKYLDIDDKCAIKYKLNPNKVDLDARLDGIKGFATNNFTLKANDVKLAIKISMQLRELLGFQKQI